ncbi:MAG: hypothetical protein WD336_07355 [Trueperaceae bacterium]
MSTLISILTYAAFVMSGMIAAAVILVKLGIWFDEQSPEEHDHGPGN